jgi:hypothetical protein
MAKVSGLEVCPSHSRVLAKALKGKAHRFWPRPSQHGMKHPLLLPRAGIRPYLLNPTSRVIPLRAEAGRVCQEYLKGVDGYPSPYLQTYPTIALAQEES